MLLRVASGRSIPFTHHQLIQLLKRPWFHGFVLAAAFSAGALYPFARPSGTSVFIVAIHWTIMAYVFIGLLILVITLATIIFTKLGWRWVFEPPLTFIAVMLSTFMGSQVSYWMGIYAQLTDSDRLLNIAVNMLVIETFILLYVHVIHDRFSTHEPPPPQTGPLNPQIYIGDGKTIHYSEIDFVEAQGHYVLVTTEAASTMNRAHFIDVVEQLPTQSGIQINRSVWIAFRTIRSVKKQRGSMTIILVNDEHVKIARPRENIVAALLRAQGHIF